VFFLVLINHLPKSQTVNQHTTTTWLLPYNTLKILCEMRNSKEETIQRHRLSNRKTMMTDEAFFFADGQQTGR